MFASSPADSGTGSGGKTRGVRLRPRVCFLSGSVGGGLEYFGLWDRLVRDVAASEHCFVFRRAGTLGGGAGDGTERFARLVFGTELRGGSGGLERRCIRAGAVTALQNLVLALGSLCAGHLRDATGNFQATGIFLAATGVVAAVLGVGTNTLYLCYSTG